METHENAYLQNEQTNLQQPYEDSLVKKPLFELSKGNITFIIGALIGSIFCALFGIFSGFALGYSLTIILLTLLFIIYLSKKGEGRIFPVICGVLTLCSSAVFICTSNSSVRFFGVIISFLLSLACFGGLANGKTSGNRNTIGIFYSAASTLGNIGVTLKSIFCGGNKNKKSFLKALIGLAFALPVLAVVMPLLISSDEAFSGMMNSIFENTFSTIAKIIFGVSISILVIPYGLSLKDGRITKMPKGKFKGIESIYIISFLSAIAICYLLYLFSQLAYFFSAFKGFLPEGDITYAQYARKGFFEMCAIAVINLIIVFTAWFIAKKKKGKANVGIQTMTTFIAVFTLVIITTAISKMVLYISAFGMTVLRLTTSAFMLFLFIVFISVICKIFLKKINLVKTSLIAASIIVLLLGTVNVNTVCAKYNYQNYTTQKLENIDVKAMYDLGDEGIPYLVKLAKSNDNNVSYQAERYLAEAYMFDYFEGLQNANYFSAEKLDKYRKYSGFDSYSIPKEQAYNALYGYIEENPGFCYICQDYYKANHSRFSLW